MDNKTTKKLNVNLLAIGIISFLWNFMGVINFFLQMNPEMVLSMPETHQAIIEHRPLWATIAFAVAVLSGTFGSIWLLRRKATATYLLIFSLIGIFITTIHTMNVVAMSDAFGGFEIRFMILMPIAVAAFLIWYSITVGKKENSS